MRPRGRRTTAGDGPAVIVAAIGGFCSPFIVHALGIGDTGWRWPAAVVIGIALAGVTWLLLRWRDRGERKREDGSEAGRASEDRPRDDGEPTPPNP